MAHCPTSRHPWGTHSWRVQDASAPPVSVLMGVPTMYSYLLSVYDDMSSTDKAAARCGAG